MIVMKLIQRLWSQLFGSASHTEPGQATTEYALVLLGAAVIALLVVAWATEGGGAGRIGELFDSVIGNILGRSDSVG
jgi:hypothetical protein